MNLEQVQHWAEEEDEKYRTNPAYMRRPIDIVRDVRYYAMIGGTRHALVSDWTTEQLERKLWERDQSTKR